MVKLNVSDVLRRELASPAWEGEPVAMGTATDPYQPCEGRYRLTRRVLEALAEFQTPLSMLTKSTLAVRDVELFREIEARAGATFAMSVGTLDEPVRRLMEPGTPPATSRLEVLRRFSRAGVRTSVLIAPIMPFLTDDERSLSRLVEACAEAGVGHVTGVVLHIRPGIRSHFWPWLHRELPELAEVYRDLYGPRSHAPVAYRAAVAERLRSICARAGLTHSQARLGPRPRAGSGVQLSLRL